MIFGKARKKARDIRTIRKYAQQLRRERKVYTQTAETYSDTDRKSRALAVGECCLKTIEAVRGMVKAHKMIPGSLEYMIDEMKVKDDSNRKGFKYRVSYMIMADEPRYTEEEIREEIEDLAKRLKIETEEIFGKVVDDGEPEGKPENG